MAALPARDAEPASVTRREPEPAEPAPSFPPVPYSVIFGSGRFWLTFTVAAAIVVIHDSMEALEVLPTSGMAHEVPHEFVRDFLFIIPVVYAALQFGLRGSIAMALLCTALSLPMWVLLHAGTERIGAMAQMTIVYVLAVAVGSRVDREAQARAEAEKALEALRVSGTKYRSLFETSGEGILIIDQGGEIADCNAAAGELLGCRPAELVERNVRDALPGELATAVASTGGAVPSRDVQITDARGEDLWVEPVATPLPGSGGSVQIVLRNVTHQRRRQSRLQSYAARVLHAQEEERQRIAQELHDDTVQSLVLLCRRIDAVEDAPVRETPAQMRRLRDDVEATIASLRDYLRGLRPAVLDDLGLEPAIRSLVEEAGERTDIDVSFAVEGAVRRLEQTAELALFRIAQEALRNMARHSSAAHGRVVLLYLDDEVVLAVTDDGVGFRPPETYFDQIEAGQLGLLGMQERARIVGGSLQIESRRGTGTTVVATVPQAA